MDARSYLERLPPIVATTDGIAVAHGSLDDPEEYARHPGEAIAQLDLLQARSPNAELLVLGHTHLPWAYGRLSGSVSPSADGSIVLSPAERFLLNPGSVGQSREPRALARCLLLDRDSRRATFFAVRYDTLRCRRALRRAGLPARSLHPVPGRVAASWGRLRRLAQTVRATAA